MNIILLLLSIVIYASFGLNNFIFIIFSGFSSFFIAKFLKSKHPKLALTFGITINVILLILSRIFGSKISLFASLGISYYVLQVISYLIDVYKGKYDAEKNLFYYMLFMFYVPHMFIGPVIRYDDMREEILKPKRLTVSSALNGFLRVAWGLLKKFIIANRIGVLISTITENTEVFNGTFALFAMLIYSIEIYADFSGGIDIVLGVSKIAGLDLKENFDNPYYAESMKDFWRRWNISLSSWFRDYIYIPLGGNRKGKLRKNINILITFLISGLWHGVNFIMWGLLHGIFVIFGDSYRTKFKVLNRLVNFLIISVLWSFFIWDSSLTSAISMIGSVFTNWNFMSFIENILNLGLGAMDYIILITSTVMLFIFDGNKGKITNFIKLKPNEIKLIILFMLLICVLVFGIYGIGFDTNEFIYSSF